MARRKETQNSSKRSSVKAQPRPQDGRAGQSKKRLWLGLVLGSLFVAATAGAVYWSTSQRNEAAKAAQAAAEATRTAEAAAAAKVGYEVVGDVVYVNNRQCAVTGSQLAEKDLGRFESRVTYDGPIERFKGKTLVFNQCCPMCIASFPKKWAAERDEIMRKFGLMDRQF